MGSVCDLLGKKLTQLHIAESRSNGIRKKEVLETGTLFATEILVESSYTNLRNTNSIPRLFAF